MAGNNAPRSVLNPPFPNVHCALNLRTEQHIINFTGANGSVTYNAAASSGGTNIVYVSEGKYTVTFPAAGTGALGWAMVSAVQAADATKGTARVFSVDTTSLTTPFAGGSMTLISVDAANDPVLNDVIGTCTLVVTTIAVPS